MIEEGMILYVDDREGTVCFAIDYNDKKYVNLFFNGDNEEYEIYEYEIDSMDSDNIKLKKVDDSELLAELSCEFALKVIDG